MHCLNMKLIIVSSFMKLHGVVASWRKNLWVLLWLNFGTPPKKKVSEYMQPWAFQPVTSYESKSSNPNKATNDQKVLQNKIACGLSLGGMSISPVNHATLDNHGCLCTHVH